MFNTISHSSTIQIETAINCYYYILNVNGAKIKNTVNTCLSKDAEQLELIHYQRRCKNSTLGKQFAKIYWVSIICQAQYRNGAVWEEILVLGIWSFYSGANQSKRVLQSSWQFHIHYLNQSSQKKIL